MKGQTAFAIAMATLILGLVAVGVFIDVDFTPYAPWIMVVGGLAFVYRQRPRVNVTTKVAVDEDGALSFQPLWVSSTEHLERFARAYGRANWAQRIVGRYPLEADMPQVVTKALGEGRMPLVLESIGRLTLTPDTLSYVADPSCRAAGPTMEWRNLDDALRFSIPLASLTCVAIHESRTVPWYPATHWVQLVGDAPEGHFNVLLAMGALRPRTARARTHQLFDAIRAARKIDPVQGEST